MRSNKSAQQRRRRLLLQHYAQSAIPAARTAGTLAKTTRRARKVVESFGRACRFQQPIRIRIDDLQNDETRLLELDRPYFFAGRSGECDIRLVHADVSYRHAYFQVIGGRLHCCDLASRTGIDRAEQPAERTFWMDNHESINIGPYRLTLEPDEFESLDFDEDSVTGVALPTIRLEFLNANTSKQFWPVKHDVTLVGSHRQCKVCFQHQSVSRVHTSLLRLGGELWAVDLLGRGGTIVNKKRASFARLKHGTILQVGRFQIRVLYDDHGSTAGNGQEPDVIIDDPDDNGHEGPAESGPQSTRSTESSTKSDQFADVASVVSALADWEQVDPWEECPIDAEQLLPAPLLQCDLVDEEDEVEAVHDRLWDSLSELTRLLQERPVAQHPLMEVADKLKELQEQQLRRLFDELHRFNELTYELIHAIGTLAKIGQDFHSDLSTAGTTDLLSVEKAGESTTGAADSGEQELIAKAARLKREWDQRWQHLHELLTDRSSVPDKT